MNYDEVTCLRDETTKHCADGEYEFDTAISISYTYSCLKVHCQYLIAISHILSSPALILKVFVYALVQPF